MDKVKCAGNNHLWVCKEESGFLNEIITFQSLTPEEITNLRQDVKNEEMICTKGTIICSRCSECLNKDHHPKTDLYPSAFKLQKSIIPNEAIITSRLYFYISPIPI